MQELTTKRLLLRAFRAGDFDDTHAFAGDAEVVRWMEWGPNNLEETRHHVNRSVAVASVSPQLVFPYAVERVEDGRMIGSVELRMTSLDNKRAEMGYVFARAAWGQGYATEASEALIAYGFGPLGLHRIEATCDPDNDGSVRVLTKLGMQREGLLRDFYLIRGEWRDRILWSVLAS